MRYRSQTFKWSFLELTVLLFIAIFPIKSSSSWQLHAKGLMLGTFLSASACKEYRSSATRWNFGWNLNRMSSMEKEISAHREKFRNKSPTERMMNARWRSVSQRPARYSVPKNWFDALNARWMQVMYSICSCSGCDSTMFWNFASRNEHKVRVSSPLNQFLRFFLRVNKVPAHVQNWKNRETSKTDKIRKARLSYLQWLLKKWRINALISLEGRYHQFMGNQCLLWCKTEQAACTLQNTMMSKFHWGIAPWVCEPQQCSCQIIHV